MRLLLTFALLAGCDEPRRSHTPAPEGDVVGPGEGEGEGEPVDPPPAGSGRR